MAGNTRQSSRTFSGRRNAAPLRLEYSLCPADAAISPTRQPFRNFLSTTAALTPAARSGSGLRCGGSAPEEQRGPAFYLRAELSEVLAGKCKIPHKFSDLRTANPGRRLEVPEHLPKLRIRLLKTVDHLARGLEKFPRVLADAADVGCFKGLPKFTDQRLQIGADFSNVSSGDRLVEIGKQLCKRAAHAADIQFLDLTHDIVGRIEHVGELTWRGWDVVVVRVPIDRQRGKLVRVVYVIYVDVVDSRDPLRLNPCPHALGDILFDNRR